MLLAYSIIKCFFGKKFQFMAPLREKTVCPEQRHRIGVAFVLGRRQQNSARPSFARKLFRAGRDGARRALCHMSRLDPARCERDSARCHGARSKTGLDIPLFHLIQVNIIDNNI